MACNKNVQELDSEKVAKAGDTMTGVLAFIAGTASAPGIAASGDADTGIFFPAANQIGFTVGGSEIARATSVGVIVNTSFFNSVGGQLQIGAGVTRTTFDNSGSTSGYTFQTNLDDTGVLFNTNSNSRSFRWSRNSNEVMRFSTGDRVLIGTATDDSNNKLQVSGNGIRISTAQTPATAGASGTTGTFAWDSTYFYICTATNTWQRVQHATW